MSEKFEEKYYVDISIFSLPTLYLITGTLKKKTFKVATSRPVAGGTYPLYGEFIKTSDRWLFDNLADAKKGFCDVLDVKILDAKEEIQEAKQLKADVKKWKKT